MMSVNVEYARILILGLISAEQVQKRFQVTVSTQVLAITYIQSCHQGCSSPVPACLLPVPFVEAVLIELCKHTCCAN